MVVMNDLLKRIKTYSEPDTLFELDDFVDVADVMRCANARIAELEQEKAMLANNLEYYKKQIKAKQAMEPSGAGDR